ncbi:hypothetical protein [Clostridium sp. UBA1056]|uniref:hypothetical protein n=1 Tax=unclassified Clostridium TaxID=2614128 RepID=UPI0032176BC3
MATLLTINEQCHEVERLCKEEGKSISEAIEIVKGCSTDQSKTQPKENILSEIIPPGAELDNNEIYDKHTGETIRDLNYKGEI